MKYHVLLTCSFFILMIQGRTVSKSIQAQPRVAFSSNVIHTYPGINEPYSENSISMNILTPQEAFHSIQNRGPTSFYSPSNKESNRNVYNRASLDNNLQNTGSFNVGYNISFNEPISTKRNLDFTRAHNKKIENAEVITGKSKKNERVQAPSISTHLSPQEFVYRAYMRQNQLNSNPVRYTSSPSNSKTNPNHLKYLNPIREQLSKYPSQSPKFTYNTHQAIFKDVIESTRPEPIQLNPQFKTSYQTSGRWKNVSPGLELNKAIEPQVVDQNYVNHHNMQYSNHRLPEQQLQNFNHDNVLKTSQTFDFSNAHGDILYEDKDNSPEGSEHYTERANIYNRQGDTNHNNNDNYEHRINQYPELGNIRLEDHIPPRFKGVKPLPLDTSLLKDAVLLTDSKEMPKDSKVIPIRFDISNIQSAMQEQLAQIQNYIGQQNSYENQYGRSYEQLLQQQQQQNQQKPSYLEGRTYEDHDQSASQNNFQSYGKPEPVNTNAFKMGYSYDSKNSNCDNDIHKIVSLRPPPVGQNINY